MEMTTAEKLKMYIDAELSDASLYRQLSTIAPDENDRQLLLEFADDEQSHADTFKRIYRQLTNRSYNPQVSEPLLAGSYDDILRDRVIDESGDFRKYGHQYLLTDKNTALKDAYYLARTDENVHALRLLYMLSK